MARLRFLVADILLAQRGTLFVFVPVCLACGIGLYFALLFEPRAGGLGLVGLAAFIGLGICLRSRSALAPLLCALSLMAAGFVVAGARAQLVAGPVLDFRYYGPITGRVVGLDRSASDALRVTLDQVWLTDVPLAETPNRVRLSLHAKEKGILPEPGMVVMTTGHLSPPSGAVEPGGFDFRRHAWFQELGAVGYTRVPFVLWQEAGRDQWLFQARMDLSARIQAGLPGATGSFAAAILTGDRSAIPRDVLEALRDTNLAHLLAISGLHMGLLSAFVFAVVRLGLLLTPKGQVWPIKKIAAGAALLAALGYLALSGGNVATERAFVMVAVMLLAVMVDKRALSLRAVALAATLILLLQPEALLGPGFQMSFAATTALVAVFGALRDRWGALPVGRVWRGVISVVLSSAVAGAATAPFAMAHFNQMAQFGLLANLLTVPLMGVLVMPFGVLALLLMPLGVEAIALWGMGVGLEWILVVAMQIAQWDVALRHIKAPDPAVLPLLSIGAVFAVIWHGPGRWLGLVPVVAAVALWITTARPHVLVAEGGGLVGVMTAEGRALSRAKGSGFVAGVWLENDGQGLRQEEAARLWDRRVKLGDFHIRHIHGKRAAGAFQGCSEDEIIVTNTDLEAPGCMVLKAQTGSLALSLAEDGTVAIKTARSRAGARLWNDKTVRQRQ